MSLKSACCNTTLTSADGQAYPGPMLTFASIMLTLVALFAAILITLVAVKLARQGVEQRQDQATHWWYRAPSTRAPLPFWVRHPVLWAYDMTLGLTRWRK